MKTTLIIISSILLSILAIMILRYTNMHTHLNVGISKWIGYSPVFYLDSIGYTNKNNIILIKTLSLEESLILYKYGFIDMLFSTNFEYKNTKNKYKNLKKICIIDKSNGADVILSNVNINILTHGPLIVYMELNTVNEIMLEVFLKKYNIERGKLIIVNSYQQNLSYILNITQPFILITYEPYATILKRGDNDLHTILTSKDPSVKIYDVLSVCNNVLITNKEKITNFINAITYAENVEKNNRIKFFKHVAPYLDYKNISEFDNAIKNIEFYNTKKGNQ